MAVLRESPWYQEILKEGRQQGTQRQLLRVLQLRFGEVSEEVQVRFSALSIEQLEQLTAVALKAESLDEFVRQLALL